MSIEVKLNAHRLLAFQLDRIITNLFRAQLVTLEELTADHDLALSKLYDALPPDQRDKVVLADYLDEERAKRMRKRTLDAGNDAKREIDSLLKSFEVNLTNPQT